MAKKTDDIEIINTDVCEFCKWGSLDETNKSKIICHCDFDGKDRIYGRSIQCAHVEIIKKEDDIDENIEE